MSCAIRSRRPSSRLTARSTLAPSGEYQIRFGLQIGRVGNDILSGGANNLLTIRWDTSLSTTFLAGNPIQRGQAPLTARFGIKFLF